ncbi:MAG: 2Fe-2S iron-sulfur cluster binding domain-containing protein [Proteobacteria bacterium]|nr:2Fe-2S iron-sulfur cluster binding domain-containing protein [Pseudomonadota bacterium]
MVQVTYIDHESISRTVEVPEGLSVMEGALRHRIPGIEGDCGGACACATCHVYVAPEWLDRLEPPSPLETGMLTMAVEPNAQSRLSCQIVVTPELEGLTIKTPEYQY